MEFKGFTPDAITFFKNLQENNNKEWFAANKPVYENSVKEPAKKLVRILAEAFPIKGLPYVSDEKKSLFRINRDIRFSKNKDPYKTNLGIFFPYSSAHSKVQDPQASGLYFHLAPEECFIAGGLHMPDSNSLLLIRNRISNEYELLNSILNSKEFKKDFPGGLAGEKLKKIPRGFPDNHPAAEYLKFKEFTVWSNLKQSEVFSPGLVNLILKNAVTIAPFLDFISGALKV